MIQNTSVTFFGDSKYLRIPPALFRYLELKTGRNTAIIEDFQSPAGPVAKFWNNAEGMVYGKAQRK